MVLGPSSWWWPIWQTCFLVVFLYQIDWPLPGENFLYKKISKMAPARGNFLVWHPQSWTFCQAWLPGLLAGGMLLWLPWVGNKGFRVCKNVWGSTSKMHRFCLVGAWLWLLGQSLDEPTLICNAHQKRVPKSVKKKWLPFVKNQHFFFF